MAASIGETFRRAGGRPSGFDYLRIGLAVAVLVWHSLRISDLALDYQGWWGPLVRMILPMFFALSGFLVASSLERVGHIHQFLMLRFMRIIPALAVAVVLSSVVIGGYFTRLPLADYFSHPQFWNYQLNIIGLTRFLLPGVFEDHVANAFNASLWTIWFELMAYALIAGMWLLGALRRPAILIPLVLLGQLVAPLADVLRGGMERAYGPVSGYTLVAAFLFGTVLYLRRDHVPMRADWALAALGLALLLLTTRMGGYLAGPAAAYFTVWLGLMTPPRAALIRSGDYSYGLYVWAYPIQQAMIGLFPGHRGWWENIALSLPVAALAAVLSWHLVEKRVLARRVQGLRLADRLMARLGVRTRAGGEGQASSSMSQ